MLGRTPVINEWLFSVAWMRRILVIHVNLALTVSFYSFICGLFVLIPASESSNRLLPVTLSISAISMIVMTCTMFIPSIDAILSNYIPVLDHPVFLLSIFMFGFGIALTLVNIRILPFSTSGDIDQHSSLLPSSAIPALQSAALLFLLSMVIFFISWLMTPENLSARTYYEFMVWGGGHILQFVNMAAAAAVWLVLFREVTGKQLMERRWSLILFTIYTLPVIFSPLLLIHGTTSGLYITGFTKYMQWGIFPVITIFIVMITVKHAKAKATDEVISKPLTKAYFNGLVVSLFLITAGFILGSMIRGSNTMVPAHYHATLGSITTAFMTITYKLLDHFGHSPGIPNLQKKAAIQPVLYGIGQAVFVAGLAYAGTHGLARKVFGEQQVIHTEEIYIGLGLLATGGLIAISGGILFLWIVVKSWRNA
ncbi:MAG TPA: hypothetical protein VF181_07655 [Balneolaceae bacterium]